jgi:hypothetical protein
MILMTFYLNKAIACCSQEWVSIFPLKNSILRNGIIIVELPHTLGFNAQNISFLHWSLKNQKGKVYTLKSRVVHSKGATQIVFTHSQLFKEKDSLSLFFDDQVPALSTYNASRFDSGSLNGNRMSKEMLDHLHQALDHHTWVVTKDIDKCKPEWTTDSIGYKIYDFGGMLVFNYQISFMPQGLDKLSGREKVSEHNPILFEVSHKGQTTICFNLGCSIGLGDCGGNIGYELEDLCDFTFKCLDAAGNYGSKSANVSVFTQRKAEPIIFQTRDFKK